MKLIVALFLGESRPLTFRFPVQLIILLWTIYLQVVPASLCDGFWKLTYTPTFTVRWPLVPDGLDEALASVHFPYLSGVHFETEVREKTR